MSILQLDRYSVLGDEWEVAAGPTFSVPLVEGREEQMLIFADRLRNGSLTADVTVLDSRNRDSGDPFNEAVLVVRYGGPNNYIFAGIGGFGAKFFLGKANQGLWIPRSRVGQAKVLARNRKYRLRVEFSGSRLTLFENDVQQLTDVDETYQLGQVGFRALNTSARFENVRAIKEKPKAFLIMPFKSEFDFVHEVIESSAKSFDIDCVRADERAVSRPVMDDIKVQIAEADVIIVDFTNKNPNVYYEAGLADAMRKDWIILVQSTEDLAFDVRHIRCIEYSNVMGADQKLRGNIENAFEALGYLKSSLVSKPSTAKV